MAFRMVCTAVVVALGAASPALAGAGSAVPEPSTLMLFGLGVAGVIIGRQGGRRPRD